MQSQSRGVPGGCVRRTALGRVHVPGLVPLLQGVPGKQRQWFLQQNSSSTHTCSALFFFREVGKSNQFFFVTYSQFGGLCLGCVCRCTGGHLASSSLESWEEAAAELKETSARLHKFSFCRVQLRACTKGDMYHLRLGREAGGRRESSGTRHGFSQLHIERHGCSGQSFCPGSVRARPPRQENI